MQNISIICLILACLLLPSWLFAKDIIPQLVLAKNFKDSLMTQAFWVSEKLDGVRCYWDGQQLQTRSGRLIHAPTWFTKNFPQEALDGELWIKRGGYQLLTKAVLDKKPNEKLWAQVSYQAFDLPKSEMPFEIRQKKLGNLIRTSQSSYLKLVTQKKMNSLPTIKLYLKQVVENGAEGLMLRKPDSLYEAGRSDHLLKMKIRQDAEARVIAYQAGRGKYTNMMGAIWVEMPNGTLFKIGTGFSDQERKSPPPIGSDITYSYQGFTDKGLPRFASFQRLKIKE
ncbi:MAG: DNA ligase [Bermanella sp.]